MSNHAYRYEKACENSSNLRHAWYEPLEGVLYVEFRKGGRWKYWDVPMDTWREFVVASSAGSFYAKHIRGRYQGARVSDQDKMVYSRPGFGASWDVHTGKDLGVGASGGQTGSSIAPDTDASSGKTEANDAGHAVIIRAKVDGVLEFRFDGKTSEAEALRTFNKFWDEHLVNAEVRVKEIAKCFE